jgi:hypothetical protein
VLREFIAVNRDEIIRRCRAKIATRSIPPVTAAEIDHGVPLFLDQLSEVLAASGSSTAGIRTGAMLHGHELQLQGLTVGQVVHDYGDVCQSITELAMETDIPISSDDFRTLNRCLDDAIAGAVTEEPTPVALYRLRSVRHQYRVMDSRKHRPRQFLLQRSAARRLVRGLRQSTVGTCL